MASEAKPAFLITIDTEGDNIWSSPEQVRTANTAYLPRFQELCDAFGFKVTYLTNYEMATDPVFVDFARAAENRKAAEVGMHLHAWASPPEFRLDGARASSKPYLIEYPDDVIDAKVSVMTTLLEDTFGHKMVSHRAGRWAMDERYLAALIKHGYLVDCSVTPYVSWREFEGLPNGSGGTDYRQFPPQAYFVDPSNIRRSGNSPILEVPMTIMPRRWLSPRVMAPVVDRIAPARRVARWLCPNDWLRPAPGNLNRMLKIVRRAKKESRSYIEFMTHSSELMPGGSPYFKDVDSIEKMYADLRLLFAEIAAHFRGSTLRDFRCQFSGFSEQQSADNPVTMSGAHEQSGSTPIPPRSIP